VVRQAKCSRTEPGTPITLQGTYPPLRKKGGGRFPHGVVEGEGLPAMDGEVIEHEGTGHGGRGVGPKGESNQQNGKGGQLQEPRSIIGKGHKPTGLGDGVGFDRCHMSRSRQTKRVLMQRRGGGPLEHPDRRYEA